MLLSDIYLLFSSLSCCLVHDNSKQDKDYALLLSFVEQARLQFAGLHSLFLALWCIAIEIGGMMKDLLFWDLMYLHPEFICCRRCFFDNWCIYIHCCRCYFLDQCICKAWYSLLQMLFFRPRYLQLALLWTCRCFSACLSCTIASTSYLFWNLKILPSQILHLHPTFSITWGCSPVKFRILNLFFLYLADTLQ